MSEIQRSRDEFFKKAHTMREQRQGEQSKHRHEALQRRIIKGVMQWANMSVPVDFERYLESWNTQLGVPPTLDLLLKNICPQFPLSLAQLDEVRAKDAEKFFQHMSLTGFHHSPLLAKYLDSITAEGLDIWTDKHGLVFRYGTKVLILHNTEPRGAGTFLMFRTGRNISHTLEEWRQFLENL